MVRTPFYDKNGVKKGAWSKEEDDKLRAYIQKYGHRNWRQLPKSAGLARCGKSCRLRWVNYLRPNLKHGNYTREEEDIIIKLHQQLGNKWSLIAEQLPGRTDNEIKNHWHSQLKKSLKRNDTSSEFKSKLSDASEGKTTQCKESESPSVFVGADYHHILESSLAATSIETSYTEENYSSLISNDAQSTMNLCREQESVASWEILQEFSSDFWSRPFIVENTCSYEITSVEDIAPVFSYPYEGTYLSELQANLDLVDL